MDQKQVLATKYKTPLNSLQSPYKRSEYYANEIRNPKTCNQAPDNAKIQPESNLIIREKPANKLP